MWRKKKKEIEWEYKNAIEVSKMNRVSGYENSVRQKENCILKMKKMPMEMNEVKEKRIAFLKA